MPDELDGQEVIESFFDAVRLRHLDQCQALLKSLETLASQNPTLEPWCMYLQGILAFEIERDWAKAERIFAALLRIDLDRQLGVRVPFGLGRSLDAQGRWEEAIAAFEQSLSLAAELGQVVEKAKAWKHLAISYRKGFTRGDLGPEALLQALAHCGLALGALEPIENASPDVIWLRGSIWNTLGLVYVGLRQWDDAIACYRQDLAACRALEDRHGMGLTYGNLGEVYQKRGSWSEALAAYQQALDLIRESDDPYEETEALANLGFLYQEMGKPETSLDYYNRAIRLIEGLRAGVSSESARAGFFATVVDIYANAVLLCLEIGRFEQAFDIIERARSRAFLDMLAARAAQPDLSREMEAVPMTAAEIQAALPADALLIEYFTTGLVEVQEMRVTSQTSERHRFPPARTLIFALTQEGLWVYDAGVSPNDLRPRQFDNVVERHFLQPQMRRTLYDKLIAPVEELVQGKRRLYLIPHGPLHYIPFQALIAPDGDTLLRQAGPQLVYAPSATLLFRYGQTKPSQAPTSCLTLGYNGEGTTRLHFAEEEARGIARLTAGHALAGPSPKKAMLYQQGANYRLLHISCHGDFDPASPLASALHLAPGEDLTALDVLENVSLSCNLVTLSACESGLSRVRRGDELVGLLRAFMVAGTPALVSTLWQVDERSTAILMEKFYHEIQAGIDFAEALKRAQLYLRNLTHEEALDILCRFLAAADEMPDTVFPVSEDRSHWESHRESTRPDRSAMEATWQQARAYLKGVAVRSQLNDEARAQEESDAEEAFSDPYYWAPFFLVGDHRAGILGKE